MKNIKNIEEINIFLHEITETDLEQAKNILYDEEYLDYICREYESKIIYDEYSNDIES